MASNDDSKKRNSILAYLSPVAVKTTKRKSAYSDVRVSSIKKKKKTSSTNKNNEEDENDLCEEGNIVLDNFNTNDDDSSEVLEQDIIDLSDQEILQLTQEFTAESSSAELGSTIDLSNDLSQRYDNEGEKGEGLAQNERNEVESIPSPKNPRTNEEVDELFFKEKVINDEGYKRIVRKRGEAFHLKKDKKIICVIEEILPQRGLYKQVKCKEYRKIENTFVGGSPEVQKILGNKVEYAMSQHLVKRNVKDLAIEKCNNPKATNLLYSVVPVNESTSFELTYTYVHDDKYLKRNRSIDSEDEFRRPQEVMDLFCGAGGASIGFLKNRFLVKWAVDCDPCATGTYMLNHPDTKVFDEGVQDFHEQVKNASENYVRGSPYNDIKPDIIWGSTPCQGFSHVNTKGGTNDEKNRSMTSNAFTEAIDFHKPKVAVLENVTGIIQEKHRTHIQIVVALLLTLGYQVRMMILESSDHGDAQARKRFFLFATQQGIRLPKRPIKTMEDMFDKKENNCNKNEDEKKSMTKRTVGDAIEELEDIKPRPGGQFILPDGRVTFNHSIKGAALKTNMEKTNKNEPANTVRTGNHFLHYKNERILSLRELARIQGFPYEYRFVGSGSSIQRQIGNAVPCNLAYAVARSVKENCFPCM